MDARSLQRPPPTSVPVRADMRRTPAALTACLLASGIWLLLCFVLLVVVIPTETALVLAFKIGFTVLPLMLLWGLYAAGLGGEKSIAALLLLIIVVTELSLRRRAYEDAGIDAQTLAKMAIWGVGLLVALLNWKVLREALREPATALLALTMVWFVGTAVYSPIRLYSFGSGIAMLGVVLFGAVARRSVREAWLLKGSTAALTALLLLGLALYVVAPERAMAPTEGGTLLRLAAPFGTPNQLGRVAGLVILFVCVGLFRGVLGVRSLLVWVGLPAALACLYLSLSRTGFGAAVISLLVLYAVRRPMRGFIAAILLAAGVLVFVLLDFRVSDLAALVSRTGRVSEIASMTGRTEIWSFVWSEILKEPILGYGYASTKLLIPTLYRTFWGWTTMHAHNMWLQTWFTTGLIGVGLLAATLAAQLAYCRRSGDLESFAILVFVLIFGMTEAAHVAAAPSIVNVFWALWLTGGRAARGVRAGAPMQPGLRPDLAPTRLRV